MTDSQYSPIRVVQNPNYHHNGTKSYVSTMQKYGFSNTLGGMYFQGTVMRQQGKFGHNVGGKVRRVSRLQKKTGPGEDDVGLVGAEDVQNDSLYLAEVLIGTPAQKFMLDFDSGSADLWIWSTELSSAITSSNTSKHNIFNPSKSSTFKADAKSSWKIAYGDSSSASGTVGTDVVTLGGLTINPQTIELADKLSEEFVQGSGDGLLGLAFSSINTVTPEHAVTPVENLIAQDAIPKSAELFTVKLGSWRDASEADKGESFYTFGYIDQASVKTGGGDIHYAPIDKSEGFWTFKSPTYVINGKTMKRSSTSNTAIADTGTTLALVDDECVKAIYAAIPGAVYDNDSQGYIFPSTVTEEQLPVVEFEVDGKTFAVQKEDLGFAEAKTGYVYGGIQSRGTMDQDILGDTFLKGVYAIFDVGNTRLGLVPHPEAKQNLTLPPNGGSSSGSAEPSSSSTPKKHGFFHRLMHRSKKSDDL